MSFNVSDDRKDIRLFDNIWVVPYKKFSMLNVLSSLSTVSLCYHFNCYEVAVNK